MRLETFGKLSELSKTVVKNVRRPAQKAHVLSVLESIVFPGRCRLCRSYDVAGRAVLCAECTAHFETARAALSCPRCAGPIGPFGASQGSCGRCRGRVLRILGTVRIGFYDGPFGEAVRLFKYHRQERFLPIFASHLATAVRSSCWYDRVEAVAGVPTHWRHRLGRPFYAAEALAELAASNLDRPNVGLLRRVRGGPHQIGLSYAQRQSNVRGAFALARGVRIDAARVLLIDDVRTTGATLEECARILLEAGCAEVYAAVAATAGVVAPSGHAITGI